MARLYLELEVDESTKRNFKSMCASKGTDMKKRAKELIENDLVNYLNEEPADADEIKETETETEVFKDDIQFTQE